MYQAAHFVLKHHVTLFQNIMIAYKVLPLIIHMVGHCLDAIPTSHLEILSIALFDFVQFQTISIGVSLGLLVK